MSSRLGKQDLIDFESEMAALFNAGRIHAPVHLSRGNEDALITLFEKVEDPDWVCCSWRSHYHCLLKGVPREALRAEILAGHSIALCFPEFRVISSAIVGGMVPIATGLALASERAGRPFKVWCFIGDMTAETGIAHECIKYAANWDLPIRFVVEDNGKSVCTDTRQVWGTPRLTYENADHPKVDYYRYDSPYPHAGAGVRVQF